MATSTTAAIHGNAAAMQGIDAIAAQTVQVRRRRIPPREGRALEILGHAIEYLSDEYVQEDGVADFSDPRLKAMLMLMEVNREIYLGCPEVPSFKERCQSLLRLWAT